MTTSATDAAAAAVERLRAARERAGQRRAASKAAVEQLRERNREETRELSERARQAKQRGPGGQPAWPTSDNAPREMRLYDSEDDAPARQPQPPRPPAPQPPPQQAPRPAPQRRASDDDWSQESWLH